ncbi:MAG: carboxypeptidase regulatory-like domain-containing protein, partial [Acidobacteria bacterium]|nr:carboxypeptidase regulatory-like domain-containing protein [Acidobacteriota bacterium]
MPSRVLASGVGLALALTFAPGAFGQGRQTGAIGGAAVDSQGLSLPGVTVTVSSPSLQGTRTAVTDINGNYSLPQLPPGAYSVVFTLSGFDDVEEEATVPLGGEVGVNAVLAPAGVTEMVQVVGVIPAEIQTTETASNMV